MQSVTKDNNVHPKIKYERIQNDGLNILMSDAISCVAVNEKIMVLGSYDGMLYVLDHQGNIVNDLKIKAHENVVNEIMIDDRGEVIASCSDDGRIFVFELFTKNHKLSFNHGQSVKTINILSTYEDKSPVSGFSNIFDGTKIVIGDSKSLILYEKSGIFDRTFQPTLLSESEGLVTNIASRSRFVAWVNNVGIRVFDLVSKLSLGLIKWDKRQDIDIFAYKCHLYWFDDVTLIIAWTDTVRICNIKKNQTPSVKYSAPLSINIATAFRTNFLVFGLSAFKKSSADLIFLGISEPAEGDSEIKETSEVCNRRPQVFIISNYQNSRSIEVYTDYLNVRGFEVYSQEDYQLKTVISADDFGDSQFFIVAPKDLLIACPSTLDDQLQWYVEHSRFEEALNIIETNDGQLSEKIAKQFNLQSIGKAYFDYLFDNKEYKTAVQVCSKYFERNTSLWKEVIHKFRTANKLHLIIFLIPDVSECQLGNDVYQLVLLETLKTNPSEFAELVQKWNGDQFDSRCVINAVLDNVAKRKNDASKTIILEALASLYCYSKNYTSAVALFLKLKNKQVFDLIQKQELYHLVPEMVSNLMNLDSTQTLDILKTDKFKKFDPKLVIEKLKHDEINLYKYLDLYNTENQKHIYLKELIRLYGKYNREKLLPFLKRSDQLCIQDALDVCRDGDYFEETAYLLDCIGNTKEAFHLIFDKLKDIEKAVTFCCEHKDNELWSLLFEKSLQKPEYVKFLLNRIDSVFDRSDSFVQQIPSDLQIPDLKCALIKLLHDYKSKMMIENDCKTILIASTFKIHQRMTRLHFRGVSISERTCCNVCGKDILINDYRTPLEPIRVYNCKHSFHEKCLTDKSITICRICTKRSFIE